MSLAVYPLLFGGGVVYYSLIEYVHHRNGGHLRAFGARLMASHQAHHRDPPEGGVRLLEKYRQRAPLVLLLSVLLGGPFLGLLWPLRDGLLPGVSVIAGLLAGYAWSEGFHHTMHHRCPRNRLERWLWRHHYVHHFVDPRVNYGFTSPLWDWVFRTSVQHPVVRCPGRLVPAGIDSVEGFTLRGTVAEEPEEG